MRVRSGGRDRGMASWVTILMLLGLAGAAYLAVVFLPPAVLHYEVKQVVRDYGNQAIKNRNDAELVEKMLQKIRSLQQVDAVDEAGRRIKVPVVDLRRKFAATCLDWSERRHHLAGAWGSALLRY